MKLTTDISPRKDGTVIVKTPGGVTHSFKDSGDGRLTADVSSDADIAYLLDSGNFYPANEADIDAGIEAVATQQDANEADIDAGIEAVATQQDANEADIAAKPAKKKGK